VRVDPQRASIDIITDTTDELEIHISASDATTVVINRFVFPNWKIEANGKDLTCPVIDFVYHCPVKAGQTSLRLFWQESGVNAIANTLSLAALALLLIIMLKK